jgi:hypothetical protein
MVMAHASVQTGVHEACSLRETCDPRVLDCRYVDPVRAESGAQASAAVLVDGAKGLRHPAGQVLCAQRAPPACLVRVLVACSARLRTPLCACMQNAEAWLYCRRAKNAAVLKAPAGSVRITSHCTSRSHVTLHEVASACTSMLERSSGNDANAGRSYQLSRRKRQNNVMKSLCVL